MVKQSKEENATCSESDNYGTHNAGVTSNVEMVIYLDLVNYWVCCV